MSGGSNGGGPPSDDGTYVQIPRWVHDRLMEYPFAYVLYSHIRLRYWNRGQGRAWPRRKDLAADLGVSMRQVQYGIDALRAAGVIRTVERRRNGYVAGLDFYLLSSPDEVASSHTAKPLNGTAVVVQGWGEGLSAPGCTQDRSGSLLNALGCTQEGVPECKKQQVLSATGCTAGSRSIDPDLERRRRRSLDHLDYSKRVALTQVSLSSSRKAFQAQPDDDDGRPETDAEVRDRMRAELARQRVARVARR